MQRPKLWHGVVEQKFGVAANGGQPTEMSLVCGNDGESDDEANGGDDDDVKMRASSPCGERRSAVAICAFIPLTRTFFMQPTKPARSCADQTVDGVIIAAAAAAVDERDRRCQMR